MFLNRVTRFYLTLFIFLFTQFYFYSEIKRQKKSNNRGKNWV